MKKNARGKRVLVIEDDPICQKMIAYYLQELNLDYVIYGCAESALEAFDSEQYDLVISDFNLPGRNGIQLIRKIKKLVNRMPAVLLTANRRVPLEFPDVNEIVDRLAYKPMKKNDFNLMIGGFLG